MTQNASAPEDQVLAAALLQALRAEPLSQAADERIAERMRAGLRRRKALQLQRADQAEWIQLCAGVQLRVLRHEPQAGRLTAIWQLAPGAVIPAHPHEMDEECLLLEGDMCHDQERYGAGDYMIAPAGSQHHRISSQRGCRMLIRGSDLALRMAMA